MNIHSNQAAIFDLGLIFLFETVIRAIIMAINPMPDPRTLHLQGYFQGIRVRSQIFGDLLNSLSGLNWWLGRDSE
jgi:hypothetical protein